MAAKSRVTATDVAREAGVSQTTVSYVLNNVTHQKISEQTRQRVLAAVARLGYSPSAAARTLRRGRSDIVLLILPDVPIGPAVAEMMERVSDDLERHGLTVISRRDKGHTTIAGLWRELMPAAVVNYAAAVSPEDLAEMDAAGIHTVGTRLDPVGEDPFSLSQIRVGRLQAGHLAGRGHQRLGYAAPDDSRVQYLYDLRLDGVRQGCAEAGLEPPVVYEVPLETGAATDAVRAWHGAGITGICAYNDEVAFALLAGARAAGLTVPGDLAVIGVDNIPLARFAAPPLTTVDQHVGTIAAALTSEVLGGIEVSPVVGRSGSRPPRAPRAEAVALVVRDSA
ncbi:LacI family DNA-binding transcriptional regulator [Streptomyces sp. NPDC057253]|uniref:LacI family DNA-binding transcriptional regulator n=1 Tax=Streptomyces sp. NPDC057253 TaxID=3346069 RepID=UPI003625E089